MFEPYLNTFYRASGIKLLVEAIKRFTLLGHKTHAAALTYTTLFALVPLLTVTFSVLSMIPALQESKSEIEQLLMGSLVPSSGDAVMGYLTEFSEQARKLTTIGIVLLIVTAFMMLRNIEDSFNQVWLLKRSRKGLSSFLLYWAILSLGPLMLSAGLAVSSYVSSMSLWKADWVPTSGIVVLGIVVPYVTSFFVFTLIYWAVPNCKVPLKHAAIGGAIVALLFEIGQEIFAEATTFFPSYQLIYGAFAAVPLFLLWLFLSWSVILLGAEIVFLLGNRNADKSVNKLTPVQPLTSTQKPKTVGTKQNPNTLFLAEQVAMTSLTNTDSEGDSDERLLCSSAQENMVGLYVLNIMSNQQLKGEGINFDDLWHLIQQTILADDMDINKEQLANTLTKLVDDKLLIQQPNGEYFLIRDLTRYPLAEFIR